MPPMLPRHAQMMRERFRAMRSMPLFADA